MTIETTVGNIRSALKSHRYLDPKPGSYSLLDEDVKQVSWDMTFKLSVTTSIFGFQGATGGSFTLQAQQDIWAADGVPYDDIQSVIMKALSVYGINQH